MDSSGSLHCLGGADGGGGGPGKNSTASQPSSSAVTAGPGSSSLSASASAFPSSPLSASGPNAKKRGRSGNAGKPAGGGGGSTAECGRLAEAMRLLQSGKLPKLDPSEERVKEEYEKYRKDVTAKALMILTDDLPRRIARFLQVVDVTSEPGTLLVCDDLPSPPSLGPLLTDQDLEKTALCNGATEKTPPRTTTTASMSDDSSSSSSFSLSASSASSFSHAGSPSFPWSFTVAPVVSLSSSQSENLFSFLQEKIRARFPSGRSESSESCCTTTCSDSSSSGGSSSSGTGGGRGIERPQRDRPGAEPKEEVEEEAAGKKEKRPRLAEGLAGDERTEGEEKHTSQTRRTTGQEEEPMTGRKDGEQRRRAQGGGCSERGAEASTCARLAEQARFVKEEAVAMRELLNAVKIFMQLHVPRIEDGNNFGVAIQEEAIHLLNRVEESAFNLYDTVMKYYVARAKLCAKLLKYPNTLDYQMAVVELDRKEWIHLKITKLDLRNNYIMLYDLICKNWQNVVAPKGRHHSTTQAALY